MGRLRSLLVLLLVLTTGSALTLACAFACGKNQAAVAGPSAHAVSHCHQAAPAKFPEGDGFRPAHQICPVMEALHADPARVLTHVLKAPVGSLAILPFESALLAFAQNASGPSPKLPAPPPARPPPPFSRNLVLRV